ncbi:hypothetical protein [Flavobacterium cerinum]|uniref:Uncharacterized protein n=1 Tax=Flavobacterium cerinum TaxID=2502784 RepID=A0ABY5ITB3_9FLAO|nr:hypothetical protein [Flavobacterium cerinum]UUC45566.1 hypothetical protein NOX80_18340 [Flavobacterium cerinum]
MKTENTKTMREAWLHRADIVNKIIEAIATRGRNFFAHQDKIAIISVDEKGQLWYNCEYISQSDHTGKFCLSVTNPLSDFKWYHGGTLKALVLDFVDFIYTGEYSNGNHGYGGLFCPHWGYSEKDMQEIQTIAKELNYLQ